MKTILISCAIQFVLIANTAFSQNKDVPGSKDYEGITRFPGSYIRFYEYKKFDNYKLRVSKINDETQFVTKSKPLAGELTRIIYQIDKKNSTAEVFKNYETALVKAGFKINYSCSNEACGTKFSNSYPSDNAPHIRSYSKEQQYLTCSRKNADFEEIVALFTVFTQDGPVARLDIIKPQSVELGQIQVTPAKIKSDIDFFGKAIIDQFFFETGKSELLPTSEPALAALANFLSANSLKVFIVGHTDNVGKLEDNLVLSQNRAQAITKKLTELYKINNERLIPKGVGSLCPISSNNTDQGRAKNRRVEIVPQ